MSLALPRSMGIAHIVLAVASMAACNAAPSSPSILQAAESPAGQTFFVGVDIATLPEPARTMAISAEKDIDLVLRGHPPACKDSPDSGESDGGTLHYKCKYYDLTVMRSIYQLGHEYGFLYGPIIEFPGDAPISYVRFYSNEQLEALYQQRGIR